MESSFPFIYFKNTVQSILIIILIISNVYAQTSYRMSLVSRTEIPELSSSIWGYTDSKGEEFALIGTREGLKVYSLKTPESPELMGFIKGTFSPWRELKTYKQYAYIVTEHEDGLLIVNLESPRDSLPFVFRKKYYKKNTDSIEVKTSHTIFINERGYCFLAGAAPNGYSCTILDLNKDPWQPEVAAVLNKEYFHEVYATADTLYSAELFNGAVGIWNISDIENPEKINEARTHSHFTHAVWKEKDRSILYSADEVSSAFVESWDISNPHRVKPLDQFKVDNNRIKNIIPHNVFHKDSFLFVSYYTEGIRVLNTSYPYNLVEVAYYDTYEKAEGGFHGCWSIYPFFSSGLIIASDIENGLFVLKMDKTKACYLEAIVVDKKTKQPIANATLKIKTTQRENTEQTDNLGRFYTGSSEPETIQIEIKKLGYFTLNTTVQLSEQSIQRDTFYLEAKPQFDFTTNLKDFKTGEKISEANCKLIAEDVVYDQTKSENGIIVFEKVYENQYQLICGKWSYDYAVDQFYLNENKELSYTLDKAYRDDIVFQYPWQVATQDSFVSWRRTDFSDLRTIVSNYPSADLPNDFGNSALITTNFDYNSSNYRLRGEMLLKSPPMDLRNSTELNLNYSVWAYGGGGGAEMQTFLLFGTEQYFLENIPLNLSGKFNPESHYKINIASKKRDSVYFVFRLYNNPDSIETGTSLRAALDGFYAIGNETLADQKAHPKQQKPGIIFRQMDQKLVISHPHHDQLNCTIINDIGQTLYSGKLTNSGQTEISIDKLRTGNYIALIDQKYSYLFQWFDRIK